MSQCVTNKNEPICTFYTVVYKYHWRYRKMIYSAGDVLQMNLLINLLGTPGHHHKSHSTSIVQSSRNRLWNHSGMNQRNKPSYEEEEKHVHAITSRFASSLMVNIEFWSRYQLNLYLVFLVTMKNIILYIHICCCWGMGCV